MGKIHDDLQRNKEIEKYSVLVNSTPDILGSILKFRFQVWLAFALSHINFHHISF